MIPFYFKIVKRAGFDNRFVRDLNERLSCLAATSISNLSDYIGKIVEKSEDELHVLILHYCTLDYSFQLGDFAWNNHILGIM